MIEQNAYATKEDFRDLKYEIKSLEQDIKGLDNKFTSRLDTLDFKITTFINIFKYSSFFIFAYVLAPHLYNIIKLIIDNIK